MDNNDDDFFNKNFDGLTNSLINELVDSTPSEKRKNKKSFLVLIIRCLFARRPVFEKRKIDKGLYIYIYKVR